MANQWEESSFDEQAIGDIETAKLALRWALDKIKNLQEDGLKTKQGIQEKSSQVAFLENQLKNKNGEIEKILRSHDEEVKSSQTSLEHQFKLKLERLSEREKEVESRLSKQEEDFNSKESKLLQDYQKKSDDLRGRWSNIESELWQLRQEQILKQQEFEKIYGGKLEDEKHSLSEESESRKAGLEKNYQIKLEELEKREIILKEELKKQEAVFKWAKDSWQKEVDEKEKKLKAKELDVEKKILEKNQELDDAKVRAGLLEKQIRDLPDALKSRDAELDRYKSSLESLEGVIRTLEEEKKNLSESYEGKNVSLETSLESEKSKYKDLESEIPKRLKIAMDHERSRFHDKLGEIEYNYKEDVRRKQEETDYLGKNLKTFEETIITLQNERNNFAQKIEQLQTKISVKNDEYSFKEKQLQSEFDIKLKVEIEKNVQSLKHEIDTAQRIYGDNLKLKVEEISHLRKEMEGLSVGRGEIQDQLSNARRAMASLRESHEKDILFLKTTAKDDYRAEITGKIDEINTAYALDKSKLQNDYERQLDNLNTILLKREEELSRFKLSLQKSEEEKKIIILEEKQKAKSDLDLQGKTFQDTAKLYEDKIVQLSKNIDVVKVEREEMLLLERDRMEKIYEEKEKDFEIRLGAKDNDIASLREDFVKLNRDKEVSLEKLSREKDEMFSLERDRIENLVSDKKRDFEDRLKTKDEQMVCLREDMLNGKHDKEVMLGQFIKERDGLKRTITELNDKYNRAESEHHLNLENILKMETEKFHNALEKKKIEIDGVKSLKESQDDSYRESLDDFRTKLSDAVGKLETVKHVADDRQNQIASLHVEMVESKKNYENEIMNFKAKLSDSLKELKEMTNENELHKNNYLKITEEIRKKEIVRDNDREVFDADISRKDLVIARLDDAVKNKDVEIKEKEEAAERIIGDAAAKSNESKLKFDVERKEFQMVIEKLAEKTREQQKVLRNENNALRESFGAKDVMIEKLSSELKGALEKSGMYRNGLNENLRKVKELEDAFNKAAGDNEMLENSVNDLEGKYNHAKGFVEMERKNMDALNKDLSRNDFALREKEDKIKELAGELSESERICKRACEELDNEKKKREELDALSQVSSSSIREKDEGNRKLERDFKQVKEELSLNLKLMEEKDESIKFLSDEVAKFYDVKKDYEKGRKIIDQLKQRIKIWKKN